MLSKYFFLIPLLASGLLVKSQAHYEFNLHLKDAGCASGSAELVVAPVTPADSVAITWSSGEKNVRSVYNLAEGSYNVQVYIKHPKDSGYVITDTILPFVIGKELCPVGVDKYFSPNGDNYHDKMGISYIQLYPNFELTIFNKWGQRVHHQEKDYEPWDGTWAGANLPDGTYYYIFVYDAGDKSKVEKGDVTILR